MSGIRDVLAEIAKAEQVLARMPKVFVHPEDRDSIRGTLLPYGVQVIANDVVQRGQAFVMTQPVMEAIFTCDEIGPDEFSELVAEGSVKIIGLGS